MKIVYTLCFSLLLLSTVELLGQGRPQDRLRMANAFEQGANVREASRIYQEVLEADPKNEEAYQGVLRTLSKLEQFNSLIPIVLKHFDENRNPEDAIVLGVLHWKGADSAQAAKYWSIAGGMAKDKQQIMEHLGQTYLDARLSSRAITAFLNARSLAGDNVRYSDELSIAYSAVGDVKNATNEIITSYLRSGDLNRARGRLSALMATSNETEDVLRFLAAAKAENPNVLRLKQWVFKEAKKWDKALKFTIELDEAYKTGGQELVFFADGARYDSEFDVALKAYGMVVDGDYESRLKLSASYGYARTMEQKQRFSQGMSVEDANTIIGMYSSIVEQYPRHPLSSEATFNMANIYLEVLGDKELAKKQYYLTFSQWQGTQVAAQAGLRLSDIMYSERNDAEATRIARLVVGTTAEQYQDERDAALYLQADFALFRGEIDSAKTIFQMIVSNPRSTSANNALERLMLLTLASEDSIGVSLLILAIEQEARKDTVQSIIQYEKAWKQANSAEIKDAAALKLAGLQFMVGRADLSSEPLQYLISRIPDTIFGDRALVLAADVYEKQKDTENAIAALTTLLVQYPKSILAPLARNRIRTLRGDA